MVVEALATAQNTGNTANFETRHVSLSLSLFFLSKKKKSNLHCKRILKRDESLLSVFIDYRPSLAPDGTFQGACATIVDVTERVGPLREALADEQHRASEAEEHRRKYELFVDMVCHEVSQIIIIIII
jgi:hypothetical protein